MGKYNNWHEAINSEDVVAVGTLEPFEIGNMKFSIKLYAVEEYPPIYECLREGFKLSFLFESQAECLRHAIEMFNEENSIGIE